MNKLTSSCLAIVLLTCFLHSVCAKETSGMEFILSEKEEVKQFDVNKSIAKIKQFVAEVDTFINQIINVKHKYDAVMAPSQKLIALCKASKTTKIRRADTQRLQQFICVEFKNDLKKRLYDVAMTLEKSKQFEKEMVAEAKSARDLIHSADVARTMTKPLEQLNASLKQLRQSRTKLEAEMNIDLSGL